MIAKIATIAAMPATGIHFLLRDLAERLAVAPHRRAQDQEVLHRAAEHDAGDQPDRAGQKAELRGQRRTDQRARRRRSPRSDGRTGSSVIVGTKSRPLFSRSAGVARRGSSPKTFSAMKRE